MSHLPACSYLYSLSSYWKPAKTIVRLPKMSAIYLTRQFKYTQYNWVISFVWIIWLDGKLVIPQRLVCHCCWSGGVGAWRSCCCQLGKTEESPSILLASYSYCSTTATSLTLSSFLSFIVALAICSELLYKLSWSLYLWEISSSTVTWNQQNRLHLHLQLRWPNMFASFQSWFTCLMLVWTNIDWKYLYRLRTVIL